MGRRLRRLTDFFKGLKGPMPFKTKIRYRPDESTENETSGRLRLFLISGPDEAAIRNQADELQTFIRGRGEDASDGWMNDLAYTLQQRILDSCRTVILSKSISHLLDGLSTQLTIHNPPRKPTVGFIFTGQGAHWAQMGKELLETYPVFRRAMERVDDFMTQIDASCNVIDEVLKPEDTSDLDRPVLRESTVSALQIALVDLLASWNIYPDSVAGHSSGEIAAAYAAGMLSMEDAMTIAYYRGVLGSNLLARGVEGSMMAVGLSAEQAKLRMATLRTGKAAVACENGPTNVTVSGDTAAIDELQTWLKDQEVFTRRIAVQVAYHSHHMILIDDNYRRSVAEVKPTTPKSRRTQFFSSVTGAEVTASDLIPEYWVRNLVEPVKFVDAVRSLCFDTGVPTSENSTQQQHGLRMPRQVSVDALVEIGPHAELAGPIRQILKGDIRLNRAQLSYYSVLVRGKDAISTALGVAASLVCQGYPVNLEAINDPDETARPQVLADL